MKQYLIEFIGAFFLVLTIALTGNPLAIGAVLIALVYMGGYISGAHYNPAVTLAALFAKKIAQREALNYMAAQVLGGLAAAVIFTLVNGGKFVPSIGKDVVWSSALLLEILYTFLLASVVLNAAATEKTKGNSYFGLAIGLTVMAGAFAAGPISGGVFNPAVALGPMLFDANNLNANMNNLLLYLIGPFIGGALASFVYKLK